MEKLKLSLKVSDTDSKLLCFASYSLMQSWACAFVENAANNHKLYEIYCFGSLPFKWQIFNNEMKSHYLCCERNRALLKKIRLCRYDVLNLTFLHSDFFLILGENIKSKKERRMKLEI